MKIICYLLLAISLSNSPVFSQITNETLKDVIKVTNPEINLLDNKEKSEIISEAPEEVKEALVELLTPRQAVNTFLTAMNKYKSDKNPASQYLNHAAMVLDLSGVDEAIKINFGRSAAERLMFVIDRIKLINLKDVPNYKKGPKWTLYSMPADNEKNIPNLEIAINQTTDTSWKFTKETVESLNYLYSIFSNEPVVEGVIEKRTFSSRISHIMASLGHETILFLTKGQWLGLIIIFGIALGLSKIISTITKKYLKWLVTKFNFHFTDSEINKTAYPFSMLCFWLLCLLGVNFLNFSPNMYSNFSRVFYVLTAFNSVWSILKIVDLFTLHFRYKAMKTVNKFDDTIVPMISKTAKAGVFLAGSILIAHTLTFDVRGLLAGLGLGGIAVALASKDTIANLFATFTVIIDRPFQIGDYVYVNGHEGTVEDLGFRSTRIRTPNLSLLSIPNSSIANLPVDNYGARSSRRYRSNVLFELYSPANSVDSFCKLIKDYVYGNELLEDHNFSIYLKEIKDKLILVEIVVFIKTNSTAIERREIHNFNQQIIINSKKSGAILSMNTPEVTIKYSDDNKE